MARRKNLDGLFSSKPDTRGEQTRRTGRNEIVRVVESVLSKGLERIEAQLENVAKKSTLLTESVNEVVRDRRLNHSSRQRRERLAQEKWVTPEERQQAFQEDLERINHELYLEECDEHQARLERKGEETQMLLESLLNPPEPESYSRDEFYRSLRI